MAEYNADAARLVEPFVRNTAQEAASSAIEGALASGGAVKSAIDGAVGAYFKGTGDSLPAKADVVGQLFVRTGSTSPGLYVSTGTTTPGWKAVSHAS